MTDGIPEPQRRADAEPPPGLLVTRRAVVLAGGASLLSACSDDAPDTPAGRRRDRRRRRRQGRRDGAAEQGETVLTQADLDLVSSRLTDLLAGEDLAAFLGYARPADATQWERMWRGLHEVPTLDRAFLLQTADGEWRNPDGGPVSATVRGVVAYRIEGCDAQPMAHLCDLSLFKAPGGRVRVQTLGPLRDEGAAPWLLTDVFAAAAGHVVLISRRSDAAQAQRVLADVDRGAARAMAFLSPPPGVSRICVTLGWPGASEQLYGGTRSEFVGSAHGYRYVEPQQLADTGRRTRGEVFDGSRVVVEPEAVLGQGPEAVAAHESVHALAYQWGRGAPPLYAEGLARYVEAGEDGTERAARTLGADGFRAFARRVTARPGRAAFYAPTWLEANYTGAAATCLHVAREQGDAALRDLVRAAYEGSSDPARTVLGMSQTALLRDVAAWLEQQEDKADRG